MQGCQCMLPLLLLLSDRGAIFLAQSPSQLSTARDYFGPAAAVRNKQKYHAPLALARQ
jgi:hypothetical protein